jgi:PPOX class probable F420-dependent enzyme
MNVEEARAFVRENHHAVLSTRRADGRPQLSPVAVALDDAGRVVISTRETAVKVTNLRRDPNVSLCVLADGFYGPWVQIDGQADVLSLPDALEPLVDYYRSVSGEHPDWDEYRAAMQQERRLVVRITIERAGPNRSG